jgi:hypothetical protein
MSLEQAITDNTAALRDLLARLSGTNAITMSATEFLQDHNQAAPVSAKVEEVKKPVTSHPAETKAVTKEVVTESPSDAALDYEKQVKPFLVKVSQEKGREVLIALLDKFGVKKGDQLPAAKLAAVLANANELLAA